MHGVIHLELKKYVETRHGAAKWAQVLAAPGVPQRYAYVSIGQYDDEELRAIVQALAEQTDTSPHTVLEDFGRYLAPVLFSVYPDLIPSKWRTLDVLANAEETIHRVVRAQSPAARPPFLRCRRSAFDKAVIIYSSPRKLCALAKGIVAGIASHYREQISLVETSCMHRGHGSCRLVIERIAP